VKGKSHAVLWAPSEKEDFRNCEKLVGQGRAVLGQASF